ncbi:hypothetical protein BD413DRAFT_492786 [Trametes elegans]|nr:hypothetical protein BD413DRAFT_492786 [Trametes elegans]
MVVDVLAPTRYQMTSPGTKIVGWYGILTDWELAKVVPKVGSREDARQPERKGTWQFMSVYYVRHQAKRPVTVADELESFFHVLLFFAVHRLHHSIDNVPSFVMKYFDSFDAAGGKKKTCSKNKRDTMLGGEVTTDDRQVEFHVQNGGAIHNRFTDLIQRMLRHFKARYEVLEWKECNAEDRTKATVSAVVPAPQPTWCRTIKRTVAKTTSQQVVKAPVKKEPSAETIKLPDELARS